MRNWITDMVRHRRLKNGENIPRRNISEVVLKTKRKQRVISTISMKTALIIPKIPRCTPNSSEVRNFDTGR